MDEFIKNVSALDIGADAKSAILEAARSGSISKAVRLLRRCRSEVLNDLHGEQERLYQIDFVLDKARFLEVTV